VPAEIKGQWFVDVSIGGISLDFEAVTSLIVVEESGNMCPTFELTASIRGLDILKNKLHADSDVVIRLGPSSQTSFQYAFEIVDLPDIPALRAKNEHLVKLSGIRKGYRKYYYDTWIKSYADTVSTEVIDEICSWVFGKSATLSHASKDSMTWINPAMSFREFVDHLWIHGYKDATSLFVPAIDLSNFIIYTDVIWRLNAGRSNAILTYAHGGTKDSRTFEYTSPMLNESTGFLGAYAGAGRSVGEWDLTGQTHTKQQITAGTATAQRVPTISPYQRRFPLRHLDKDNVHENFNVAYLQNQTNLARFSQVGGNVMLPNQITVGDTKRSISLLDKVTFLLENPESEGGKSNQSDTFFSGDYIVTKISRAYGDSSYYERIYFCRDGFGQVA